MTFLEHLDSEFVFSKQAILFTLNNLPKAKTIVVNIGVGSLVHNTGLLNIRTFKNFIKDIAELINSRADRNVVIVVSDYLEKSRPKYLHSQDMPSKSSGLYSALATLAHNDFANLFSDGFSEYSLRAIGVSLSAVGHDNTGELNKLLKTLESVAFSQTKDLETKIDTIKSLLNSKRNITKTSYQQARLKKTAEMIRGLFRHFPRTIPIVMEDASEAGQVGDEEFAARIAVAVNADALVAISKKGMLYTADPGKAGNRTSPFYCYDTGRRTPFDEARRQALSKKLNSAAYVNENDKPIPMLLASNCRPFAITNMFCEENIQGICTQGDLFNFTLFINSQNRSLPIETRYISGKIVVDSNAAKALVGEKRSLLLAGVVGISGEFETKSVVSIVDENTNDIGKGVVNFSAKEIAALLHDKNKESEIISREKMRLIQL